MSCCQPNPLSISHPDAISISITVADAKSIAFTVALTYAIAGANQLHFTGNCPFCWNFQLSFDCNDYLG
jgi:hypothetical protein